MIAFSKIRSHLQLLNDAGTHQEQPTYQMQPRAVEEFPRKQMQMMLQRTVSARLEGERYESKERGASMARDMVEVIQRKVIDSLHFIVSEDDEVGRGH